MQIKAYMYSVKKNNKQTRAFVATNQKSGCLARDIVKPDVTVNRVQWLKSPSDSLVIHSGIFRLDGGQLSKVFLSFWDPTDQQKHLALHLSSVTASTLLILSLIFAVFQIQSPLLTMTRTAM